MSGHEQFYIGGRWVAPLRLETLDVIDPSTEQPFTRIAVGSAADVDRAVVAARAAFEPFAQTSREGRVALLERILDRYDARADELAEAVSREMGRPCPSPAPLRSRPGACISRRRSRRSKPMLSAASAARR